MNSANFNLRLTVQKDQASTIEECFEDTALAISSFENPDNPRLSDIEFLFEEAPDLAVAALQITAALGPGQPSPKISLSKLEQVNWLEHSYQGFSPITAGRFTIRSDYDETHLREDRMTLWIEAATAFGTGEHATTFGCLVAFSDLLKRGLPSGPVLDMGCGSGILAIAAAKALKRPVLAADIDPEAARVTARHAIRNGEQTRVHAICVDGFGTRTVAANAPYHLILANILAKPLCDMARDLKTALAPGGSAILSGLLTDQEQMVLASMRANGLKLCRRYRIKEWSTLVVRR